MIVGHARFQVAVLVRQKVMIGGEVELIKSNAKVNTLAKQG